MLKHPTTKETIHRIIEAMEPDTWYPFGELWGPAYEYSANEKHQNKRQIDRCFARMIAEKLITTDKTATELLSITDYSLGAVKWAEHIRTIMSFSIGGPMNWQTEVCLTGKGDRIRESGGYNIHWETVNKPKNYMKGLTIGAIIEVLIGLGLLYFAYRTDVRADRIDKQETKYTEREKEVEALQKLNNSLRADIRALMRADSIQKAKASIKPSKTAKKP